MKTKNRLRRFLGGALMGLPAKALVAGAFTLMALGCSDGALPVQGGTSPGEACPPAPEIVKFEAKPNPVNHGSTVTLSWKVTGADKIEIGSTDAKNKFSYVTEKDFESTTTSNPLQVDTTFMLTATTNSPKPAEGTEVKKQTTPAPEKPEEAKPGEEGLISACLASVKMIQVKVTGAQALAIEQFFADATQTAEGEYSAASGQTIILQWSVVPEEAEVELKASTGEQPVKGDCTVSTTKEMEDGGEVVEKYSATDCATVKPVEDTVYTLQAKLGDEEPKEESLTVVVSKPTIELTMGGLKDNAYLLIWRATPDTAKVTLTAEPALAGVNLPADAAAAGDFRIPSSAVVQTTVITATAKVGNLTAQDRETITVGLGGAGLDCSQFIASANAKTPLLSGERVAISWQIPEAARAAISSIQVTSSMEMASVPKDEVSVEMYAKAGGYKVVFQAAGKEVCPTTVNVPVAMLEERSREKAVRVVRDAADPKAAYVGLDKGFNGGKIGLVHYTPIADAMEIDFFKALQGYDQLNRYLQASFMEKAVQTFPVNAITSSASRLFVATTGAVLYQDGSDWKTLAPLRHRDWEGSYKGAEGHPTCFGMTQKGKDAARNPITGQAIKGDITTLRQVCDMVATDDGKLYAATDQGLFIANDVEAYIQSLKNKNPDNSLWTNVEELKGSIVNDVEVFSSGVILAGGSKGVYRYDAASAAWVSMNGGALGSEEAGDVKTVYSVAAYMGYLGPVIAIYPPPPPSLIVAAGSDDGVYMASASGVAWEKKEMPKVYSIAVDPYNSDAIYVGTGSGLYVSHNGGESFASVATPMVQTIGSDGTVTMTPPVVVRSIGVYYDGVVRESHPAEFEGTYYMYLATETGVLKAYLSEVKFQFGTEQETPPSGPVTPEPVPATPAATRGVTVVDENGEVITVLQ